MVTAPLESARRRSGRGEWIQGVPRASDGPDRDGRTELGPELNDMNVGRPVACASGAGGGEQLTARNNPARIVQQHREHRELGRGQGYVTTVRRRGPARAVQTQPTEAAISGGCHGGGPGGGP